MQNGLDRLLATYCSPTLAGIKPASLVSCDRNLYPDLPQRLKEYRDAFSAREIHFEIVCACSARFLLLVYSKPQLERRMRTRRCSMCSGTLRTRSVSRSMFCCAISSAASPCPRTFRTKSDCSSDTRSRTLWDLFDTPERAAN